MNRHNMRNHSEPNCRETNAQKGQKKPARTSAQGGLGHLLTVALMALPLVASNLSRAEYFAG